MKKALLTTFHIIIIFIFILIFFSLYGRVVRHIEIHNALELSMEQAIEQLQLDEGFPSTDDAWTTTFINTVASQIQSNSNLKVLIYAADREKGLLSAEAILTFPNLIGGESSVSTGKRTIILEKYNNTKPNDSTHEVITKTQASTKEYGPYEQMVIQAGYGVIVKLDENGYGILTHGDGCVNGIGGNYLLSQYLETNGMYTASGIGGCWIDSEKDLYWFTARNVQPLSP